MRDTPALSLAAALALSAVGPAHAAEPIVGRWFTEDGSAVIRVDRCGAKVCGVIERVLSAKAPGNDVNNPDTGRRGRSLVGTVILSDLSPAGAEWSGRVYDPRSGGNYRSRVKLQDADTLKVTGCLSFICRSQLWRRAA